MSQPRDVRDVQYVEQGVGGIISLIVPSVGRLSALGPKRAPPNTPNARATVTVTASA